jgi:hypothetical protein
MALPMLNMDQNTVEQSFPTCPRSRLRTPPIDPAAGRSQWIQRVEQISNTVIIPLGVRLEGLVRNEKGWWARVVRMARWLGTMVLGLASLVSGSSRSAVAGQATGADDERFENEIRPVLATTCFPCHGGKKTSGGLKVSTRDALLKGGDSGPAVVPHHPETSLLIRAIGHADESHKMPPAKRLTGETVAAFTQWVERGAQWPDPAAKTGMVQGVRRLGNTFASEQLRLCSP